MRISTSLAFERAIETISDRQSQLMRTQEELGTGKKLLRPSDDPVGAAEAERARSQMRRTELEQRMTGFARDLLGHAEATLGQVTDLMHSIREHMIQAGNGSLGPPERQMLATQMAGFRDELLALANRRDGAGAYLFGGQGSRTAPFVDDGTNVSFTAAPGEQLVGVDQVAPTSQDGREAFMSVPTATGMKSIFAVIDDAVAVLGDAASSPAAVTAAVQQGLAGIDAGFEQLLVKRTEIGEDLRVLDSRDALSDERLESLNAKLADLVYVDLAKAISDSANNQIGLEAAMKTYSEISRLSLFQYI